MEARACVYVCVWDKLLTKGYVMATRYIIDGDKCIGTYSAVKYAGVRYGFGQLMSVW